MNYAQQLAVVESIPLEMSGTHRGDCPFCGRNNTFYISMEGHRLRWVCFSSNCSAKGEKNVGVTLYSFKPVPPKVFEVPEGWVYQEPGFKGHPEVEGYLYSNHCDVAWNEHRVAVYHDVARHRVVFAVITGAGRIIGGHGRKLDRYSKGPKWYKYGAASGGFVVRSNFPGDTLVIVEDVPSACNVSQLADSLALTGTQLTDTIMGVIKRGGWKKVVICLDKDATKKALIMTDELRWYMEATMVILERDLKYLSVEELKEKLDDYV